MRGLSFLYKVEITYEYDGNNYRVFKQTPTEKTYYNYDGSGNLRFERRGRTEINYIYDAGGIRGMKVTVPTDDPSTYYASSEFYYVKDSLGNIRVILDKSGNIMVEYNYDAWGNFIAEKVREVCIGSVTVDLVSLNAFTYRGYYYDKESGLYYLINRYYDPTTGRFISPDDVGYLDFESFFGTNRYAYCLDDPVNESDPTGHFAISTFLIGLTVTSLISWGLSEIFGAQIVGGVGSIANGISSILSSVSLFAFGPVGWVIGGIGIVAGLASIAFGTAEIQEGLGYGNWIKDIGVTGNLYTGLYVGSNIVSSLTTIGGNAYRNSKITNGVGQAGKTGSAYSRYYQLDGKNVKSITHYGKGGIPKYRIDVLGRPHNGILPHKHNFVINNGFVNKGSVDDINYLLWLLFGNWR